jgi:hypothetical protein
MINAEYLEKLAKFLDEHGEKLESFGVLNPSPGDVIVLTTDKLLSEGAIERLKKMSEGIFSPELLKCIVLEDGLQVAGLIRSPEYAKSSGPN